MDPITIFKFHIKTNTHVTRVGRCSTLNQINENTAKASILCAKTVLIVI